MISSIKARIILFYLLVLFVVLSALGVLLHTTLDNIVYNSIDSILLSKAKSLATIIYEERDDTEFDFSDETMWEYNSPKAKSYFQIRDFNGIILESSESLGDGKIPLYPQNNEISVHTILVKNMPTRLVNYPFQYKDETADHINIPEKQNSFYIIQCAEDISSQILLLRNYKIILWLSILSTMIISTLGGLFIAGKALAPVKNMSETVSRFSEDSLSERIPINDTPKELQVLASAFNKTLGHLAESFNVQKQFTADASHELRTPLSVILSQSDITLRKERSVHEYKEALGAIMAAAKIMSTMVNDLLLLARLNKKKILLEKEKLDLSNIIGETVRMLTPSANLRHISFSLSDTSGYPVYGEREHLLRLFINIIDNAIKYGKVDGKINISTIKEGEFVISTIQDNGIGIPEEHLGRIFDRFYRVDQSRSQNGEGVGLGMSICQEIIRQHSGKIEIRSSVGKGTSVSIYLRISS
jgi:heavy metal sensor kinase